MASKNQDEGVSTDDGNGTTMNHAPLHVARRNLLKAVWETSFAPRFSSRPIDMEDYFSRESFVTDTTDDYDDSDGRHSIIDTKNLTTFEQSFLENLLQSEDLESIRRASERLSDKQVFPPPNSSNDLTQSQASARRTLNRRESDVQQELFRLHQQSAIRPSTALQRMRTHERQNAGSSIVKMVTASTPLIPPLQQASSILTVHSQGGESSKIPPVLLKNSLNDDGNSNFWDMIHPDGSRSDLGRSRPALPAPRAPGSKQKMDSSNWNPFGEINSWIDGNQGVEVDDGGVPIGTDGLSSPTSNPFQILGTSADDVTAHPHVLTPPLMEGLQEFMPESIHKHHFWLKYSLVRDGHSSHPGHLPLLDLLRQCRASQYTVLAMETTSGHVFGAFCSQPWRLQDDAYWGTKDSFVWKMRRPRNEPCESIVEQVLMESKFDVFPFTGQNSNVQRCSHQEGLILGEGELAELSTEGEHFGHAIRLSPSMVEAWTSTCETFGSPCLVPSDLRGEHVEIANVELWALTPHRSIESAVTAEMRQLFLAERGNPTGKNLNIFEILVGGPV